MGELALTFDPANVKNVCCRSVGGGSNLSRPASRLLLADFADDGVLQTH